MTGTGRKLQLVAVVWGEWHVSRFLEFCVPSLLAPGNLPAIAASAPVAFDIVTSISDKNRIERAPVLATAAAFASLSLHAVPAEARQIPYEFVHMVWEKYRAQCQAENALLVLIIPDDVYSNAALTRCLKYLGSGKAAFHARGHVRCIAETMEPELVRRRSADGTVIDINGAQLAELSVKHLHACNASVIADNVVSRITMEAHFRTPNSALIYFDASQDVMAMDPALGAVYPTFHPYAGSKKMDWCVEIEDAFAASLAPFHYTWHYLSVLCPSDASRELARLSSVPHGREHPSFIFKRVGSVCRSFDGEVHAASPLHADPDVASWEENLFSHQRLQALLRGAARIDPTFGRLLMLAYVSNLFPVDELLQQKSPGLRLVLSVNPERLEPIAGRDLASLEQSDLRRLAQTCLGTGKVLGETLIARSLAGHSIASTIARPKPIDEQTGSGGTGAFVSRFGDLILVDRLEMATPGA